MSDRDRLGAFRIHRDRPPLGRGGMGVVYAGTHDSGLPVAIKVMAGPRALQPRWRARFAEEARAVAGLDHENIVRVLDFGELPDGAPYLVLERAVATLAERVPLAGAPAFLEVMTGLLRGLAHAHARRLVHGDVKPSNVLAVPEPGRVAWRLSDFGISLAIGREERGVNVAGMGSRPYMAPEQKRGDRAAFGPWTDLWAVGCVAWELVVGRPPVLPLPPFPPGVDAPPELWAWIARLVDPDPTRRPAFAADAARALAAIDLGGFGGPAAGSALAPTETATATGGEPSDDVGLAVPWMSSDAAGPAALDDLPEEHVGRPIEHAGLGLLGLRAVPLVGRRAELQRIADALAEARGTGRAAALVFTGPEGIGKSRLLDEAAARLHERGAATVWRRDVLTGGDAAAVASAGRALLASARARPAILVLDDPDPAALDLVRWLLRIREVEPGAVLALVAARDAPDLPVAPIRLGALDATATARLLSGALGLDPDLAARVREQSGGNPGRILDEVADLAPALARGPRGFVARGTLPGGRAAAERVADLLASCPEAAGPVGLLAALGGRPGEEEWVACCATLGVAPHGPWLDAAARAGVLRARGLAVRDEATRRALLARPAAPTWHAAVAATLGDPGRVGVARLGAGDAEGAVVSFDRAVSEAIRAGDYHRAESWLVYRDDALTALGAPSDDPRRALGLVLRTRAARLAGELAAARGHADAAVAIARGDTRPWALVERAYAEQRAGRVEPARDAAREALDAFLAGRGAGPLGTPEEGAIEALRAVAGADQVAGRLLDAVAPLADALARAERIGRLDQVAAASRALGNIASRRGEWSEAERWFERAVAAAEATGLALLQGDAWWERAINARRAGDLDTCDRWLARAVEAHERSGNLEALADLWNDRGETARARGELVEAEACYRKALAIFEAVGSGHALTLRLNLALTCIAAGRLEAAEPELEAGAAACATLGRDRLVSYVAFGLAVCRSARGDLPGTQEALARGADVIARFGEVDPEHLDLLARVAAHLPGAGAQAIHAEVARRLGRGPDVRPAG